MVTHLTAAFGVEGRAIQNQRGRLTRAQFAERLPLTHDRQHTQTFALQVLVAKEHGRIERCHQLRRQAAAARELAGRPRLFTLLRHGRIEARHIHTQTALTRHVRGEIHRETVGVVKAKGVCTGNFRAGTRGNFIKNPHSLIQRLGKPLLFRLQGRSHHRPLLPQFGIGLAHLCDQAGDHLVEEGLAHAQHPAMTQSATNDPAQHIATTFVAG